MTLTLLHTPSGCIETMTPEQRDYFGRYHRLEQKYHKPFKIYNTDITPSLKNNPALRLIHQRVVEWGNAEISTSVAIFLAFLSGHHDATAGKAVLWSFTVTFLFHQNERMVTMNDLAFNFQFGFPNDDGIKFIWDQQKDESQNSLNNPQQWKAENFYAATVAQAIA